MTSIEFHLRTSSRDRRYAGSIFIRVIHQRKAHSVTTDYRLFPEEWDTTKRCIIAETKSVTRLLYLKKVEKKLEEDLYYLTSIVEMLELNGEFTASDVTSAYKRRKGDFLLSAYVEKLSNDLIKCGQGRTARAYSSSVKNLLSFNRNKEIALKHITPTLLRQYESNMREKGKSLNTISFYMRNLRAIYNKAIKDRLIERSQHNPFESVYTGIQVTKKRALTKDEMKILNQLEASFLSETVINSVKYESSNQEIIIPKDLLKSLSLFFFSFHARGMSFVDMVFLKKEDIQDGVLSYFRKKTGQQIDIKLTLPMRQIMKLFEEDTKDSIYVFPLIKNSPIPTRLQYESALRIQNDRLKRIGKLCGIKKTLSTHVARHTWATIAKGEHLPLSVISEGLGHSSEKTTSIYLASFDRTVLDRAGDKVAKAIKNME